MRVSRYFPVDALPDNFDPAIHGTRTEHGYPVGAVTYNSLFTPEASRAID
jgi:hypothetical protein